MKRRDFLRIGGAPAAALLVAGPEALAKPASALRLTLLHTNDVHSHLEPRDDIADPEVQLVVGDLDD